MSISVECKTRPESSKPKALRREGLIPAALYGHDGANSLSLTLPAKEALLLLRNASVNNTAVDLSIPEIDWKGQAIIREVQAHPWKRTVYHLSFFYIPAGQSINLVVPIEIVGESAGAKEGGILEQNITELNINCTPKNIPESIQLDVSSFEIGSSLSVGEINVPEGVEVLDDPEQTVFSIGTPTLPETEETEDTVTEVIEVDGDIDTATEDETETKTETETETEA